ncbi:hypothetical protein L083_1549 [Actinoplanes sp. N902-109]|nr:hypothetical protein L083_1549 [Actinoplanes sp. N902-109]
MGWPGGHDPAKVMSMDELRGTVTAVSSNGVYSFTKPNRDRIVLVPGLGVEGDVHAGVRVRHRSRVAADPAQPNLRQVHLISSELFDEVRPKGYEVPSGGLGENVTTAGLDLLALPCGTILRFGAARPPAAAELHPAGHADPATEAGEARAAGVGAGEAGATEVEAGEVGAGDVGAVLAVVAAARAATLDAATAGAVEVLAATVEREAARSAADERPAIVLMGLRNPCAQINKFRPGLLKEVLGHDDDGGLVRKAGVMAVVLRGGAVRAGDVVTAEVPAGPHQRLDRV